MPAPESRSPSLASKALPAATVLLALLIFSAKAWHVLPRLVDVAASSLRDEPAAKPPPPRLTRIDDSIFRPLRIPAADPFGYPAKTVDKREFVALLTRGEFDALDRRMEELHRQVLRDVRYEYHLLDAFMSFRRTDRGVRERLDGWVAARPGSAHARLARAMYLVHAGWKVRGGEFYDEVEAERREQFRQFVELAARDARAALEQDGAHLVGYHVLLSAARSFAPERESRRILDEGLRHHPDSYVLRESFMMTLEPRWGGSYRKMRAFGAESARRAVRNPRLGALRGAEHVDRAWHLRRKKDYAAALAEYDKALAYGPEREALLQRGRTYYLMDDYARAHADLELALQQRPQGPEALEYHGRSLYHIARAVPVAVRATALARAAADFDLLAAIDPDNDDVAEWRGHVDEMKRWCARLPEPCK